MQGLRYLIGLQSIVIVGALAIEAYAHESIVGSGPVFSIIGLIIAVLAVRDRDYFAMLFGLSALVFTLIIALLINVYSWSPEQGDRPITIMCLAYAAVALPESIFLVMARRERSAREI